MKVRAPPPRSQIPSWMPPWHDSESLRRQRQGRGKRVVTPSVAGAERGEDVGAGRQAQDVLAVPKGVKQQRPGGKACGPPTGLAEQFFPPPRQAKPPPPRRPPHQPARPSPPTPAPTPH